MRRDAPNLIAEFLNEVRVTAGDFDGKVDRVGTEPRSFTDGRFCKRVPCILAVQGVDLWELGQSLRIRLRVAGEFGDLGQSGADKSHRQIALHRLVNGLNESLELGRGKKLHLVDEDDQSAACFLSGFANGDEYIREVHRQVSVIRVALRGRHIP